MTPAAAGSPCLASLGKRALIGEGSKGNGGAWGPLSGGREKQKYKRKTGTAGSFILPAFNSARE